MKYLKISLILAFVFVLSSWAYKSSLTSQHTSGKDFKAELVRIEYYNKQCKPNYPITVREVYKLTGVTNYADIALIYVKDGKEIENYPVKAIDSDGNVVMSYCATKKAKGVHTAYFININGGVSNKIVLQFDVKNGAIINSKPPILNKIK